MRYLQHGVNPIEMKRGMDLGRDRIIEYLAEIKHEIQTKEELLNLARVSTNHDPLLSNIICDAVWEVGIDGQVEIEPGNFHETHLVVSPFT